MRQVWEERTHGARLPCRKKLVWGTPLDEWRPVLTGEPVPQRRRPLSPEEQRHLRIQTGAWLKSGVVEKVRNLPWVNNTVFVAKQSGAIRVCVDCTPINMVTASYEWPLPRLQDLRNFVRGARWFSRMDLKDAFFRIGVPPAWRAPTAFTCDGVDYQFTRMPFGLKTAPSVFQRWMDHVLAEFREFAFWYIDDVLVWASDRQTLITRTSAVKEKLLRTGNVINESKSEYEKQELPFAGMLLRPGTLNAQFKHVENILQLPVPRTKAEKQSALGLVSYLRDFIPLVSHFTAELSIADGNTLSEEEYEKWWGKLRSHVANRTAALEEWDETANAELFTDASSKGCSAILLQRGRIVALASRKLTGAETRYSATDREHLGLLLAAEKFRMFLHRPKGETQVWSDHAALLTRRTNQMTPRQTRWSIKVNQWISNLRHVKGKENPADYFSRWIVAAPGGIILA